MTANGSLNGRPSDKRRKGAKLPLNGCLKLTREGLATAETSHSTACTSVMYASAAGFTTCPVHLSSAHVVFKAHDRRMCRTCHASPDSPYPTEPCSRWEPRRRPNPSKCHLRRMTAGPGNVKAQCHFHDSAPRRGAGLPGSSRRVWRGHACQHFEENTEESPNIKFRKENGRGSADVGLPVSC
jgi:hypothetical protein